jgi:hypothetical protein
LAQQEELDRIASPPDFKKMSEEHQLMVWRFRYSQQKNKKMLVKLLQCVKWNSQTEMTEAMSLLNSWEEIEEEQALALLAGYFCLNEENAHMRVESYLSPELIKRFKEIRNHAVKCLRKIPNERIDLISLQLCQALRYEEFDYSNL